MRLHVNVRSLASLSHVDEAVIQPFLPRYWEQQRTEQERLEAFCAALDAARAYLREQRERWGAGIRGVSG